MIEFVQLFFTDADVFVRFSLIGAIVYFLFFQNMKGGK